MAHEVIMPALGMAQETGKLVAWLKNAGDPVKAGDPLLEVETDKSVMEVEAEASGFLTHLRALAGDDVPVGAVIAHISDSHTPGDNDEIAAPVNPADHDALPVEPTPSSARETQVINPPPKPAWEETNTKIMPEGVILASPKAKRLAQEQGLNLADLVARGARQPFHVSDVETLKSVSGPGQASRSADVSRHIAARVERSASEGLLSQIKEEGLTEVRRDQLWLAFAAAAWRKSLGLGETSLTISLIASDGTTKYFCNADFQRLSQLTAEENECAPALSLRDFTHSAITSVQLGTGGVPILSFAADEAYFALSLDFTEAQLPDHQAIAFVTEFAARLSDPLKYLL